MLPKRTVGKLNSTMAKKKPGIIAGVAGAFVGGLIGPEKSWTDWSLVVGAVLITIGLGLTTITVFDLSRWLQRHGQYPCLGSIGLGSVFFTMGFVMDLLRHRSIRHYREQLAAMEQSIASLPVESQDTHE